MGKIRAQELWSSRDLGAVFGLTERRVQQMDDSGVFKNIGEGRSKRYVLADAVRAWGDWKEKSAEKKAYDSATSREEFEHERARKLKLENDHKEAILMETADGIAAVDHIAGMIGTALGSIPARVTEDVALRRRIESEIDAVRNELANTLQQASDALREGRDPLAAGGENQP